MTKKEFTLIYQWNDNDYRPDVRFELGMNEIGFTMHITIPEANPMREKTEHFDAVWEDSCVEWFVNFAPEICDRYFNFEVNALGTINVSFRKDRYDSKFLELEDVESLNIQTEILEDRWIVDYTVPFTLIEKYIPGYEFKEGMTIKANFYKCGGEIRHHGMWQPVKVEKPDFHRPEYFGEIVLD